MTSHNLLPLIKVAVAQGGKRTRREKNKAGNGRTKFLSLTLEFIACGITLHKTHWLK